MASYNEGKKEVVTWIANRLPDNGTILDVGACDGRWADFVHLLRKDAIVDGIEIYEPNVYINRLVEHYRLITIGDIADLRYKHYDIVIFGDVLEHMTVETAQRVLKYAAAHSTDYIIGIPFLYPQDEIYGNKWEKHIQPDLTPEIFDERYPGHELIIRPRTDYAYYHRKSPAEQPTCGDCPMHYNYYAQTMCPALHDEYGFDERVDPNERRADCPLKE